MPKIERMTDLTHKLLSQKAKRGEKRPSVIVGYTAQYAIYVHENLEAYHPVGQAKYLEQPARELNNDGTLAKIVQATMASGGTLEQGLVNAGNRLQRDSQKLVPIDTGNLRASAFTRKEQGNSYSANV